MGKMGKIVLAMFASVMFAAALLATAGPASAQGQPATPLDKPLPEAGQVQSQKADKEALNYSATQMARRLADAYGREHPAGTDITFESVTVQANMVEVKWTMTNPAFLRLKNDANEMRLNRTSAYCDGDLAYLNEGVIVREVFARSDHSDRVDFTINNSSCDDQKCARDARKRAQKKLQRVFRCDSIRPADCFGMYRRRMEEQERQELAQCPG
jgi:hypothetical protein